MKTMAYNHVTERNISSYADVKTPLDRELYEKHAEGLRTAKAALGELYDAARMDRDDVTASVLDKAYNIVSAELDRFTAGEGDDFFDMFGMTDNDEGKQHE